jgi:myo-inositol 2-dehydrogenase/D-chiro-inositol 1-dehydrogenase/scyllo-inositol 2-dehydrogenase (NAD+)
MSIGTSKLGIAVIGSGRAGMIHARNFATNVQGAKLVAMVDADLQTAKAAAAELEITTAYGHYEEALQNNAVDAVVIVTPTKFHKEVAIAAAQAGKHILCEKPMAMNATECEAMIKAVKEAGIKFQLGFMRRYDSSFQYAKQQIESGAIGNVVLVKSVTRGPSIPQPWMYDIAASNGPLAEVNSHDIDTLRWFTGSEFTEVYAIGGNYRSAAAKTSHPDFYDNVVLIGSFENGMQGYIDGAQGVLYGYDARMEIVGTEGVIFVGRTNEYSTTVCNVQSGSASPFTKSWRTLFTEAYLNEDKSFVDCILNNKEPITTAHDGMMAVKVVNAGNTSITEKRVVKLDEDVLVNE